MQRSGFGVSALVPAVLARTWVNLGTRENVGYDGGSLQEMRSTG